MPETVLPSIDWIEDFDGDYQFANYNLIVSLVESSFSITLSVNGLALTGELIGEKEYHYISADIQKAWSNDAEISSKFTAATQKRGDNALEILRAANASNDTQKIKEYLQYFHLKNASLIFSRSLLPTPGMLWRGRTADVNAWAINRLNFE